MYSIPAYALRFAAQCRLRLKLSEAPETRVGRSAVAQRTCNSIAAHHMRASWHAACWGHRSERGSA